jgi:hypothetical protein
VGNVEWSFVLKQANKRAICPWCKEWHIAGEDPHTCQAVYLRNRDIAICARTLDGGHPRRPVKAEIVAALKHARARKNQRK